MSFSLKKLRTEKDIPAKDMVEVIKALFPKYDKTIQSKCENGELYGVCLLPEAVDAVCKAFAPELKHPPKKDTHRLTCRISCRLENADYEQLQHNLKADGYTTIQDWLTIMVRQYNKEKEQNNESNNDFNG